MTYPACAVATFSTPLATASSCFRIDQQVSLQSRAMGLVLASASPRRQELLRSAGIAITVQPTNIPETPNDGEAPRAFAERLALEKAWAVFKDRPGDFVLGADTIVVVDKAILGKPKNPGDAARMLHLLSGRTHQVTTGVCLMGPRAASASNETSTTDDPLADTRSETTLVTMSELSDNEI